MVARERGVSVNVIMNMALSDYLERLVPLEDLLKTASSPRADHAPMGAPVQQRG